MASHGNGEDNCWVVGAKQRVGVGENCVKIVGYEHEMQKPSFN